MPPRPPWHARIAQIRTEVAALTVPVLDRALIEHLFQIERRTAQRLLRTLDGHLSAQAALVPREAVLRMLDDLMAQKPIAEASSHKTRLADALRELEREAVPKTTAIATIAGTDMGWPEGIALASRDTLAIRFTHAEDLLGRILALTEMAAADYAGFAARLAQEPGA